MTEKYVGENEYLNYLNSVKLGRLSSFKIDDYCGFLDGKKVREKNQDAQQIFLQGITKKTKSFPYYAEETEKYIKSREFSSKMKKCIASFLKGKLSEELKKILESTIDFSDMEIDDLMEIEQALEDAEKESEEKPFSKMFERYMLVLDSYGAKMFIRNNYSFKELALLFLNISNIDLEINSKEPNKSNGLLVGYMMAIYRMYHKYLPEYETQYLKLIRQCHFLSQMEFVEGYNLFVTSNFVVKREMIHKIDKSYKIEDEEREYLRLIKSGEISIEDVESKVSLTARRSEDSSREEIIGQFNSSLEDLKSDKPLANVVKRLVLTWEEKEKLDKSA